MRRQPYRIAIDIFCDGKDGEFRLHISAAYKKWFWSKTVESEELEVLKDTVVRALTQFGAVTRIQRFSPDFMDLVDDDAGPRK
jgi:hypothetical protein